MEQQQSEIETESSGVVEYTSQDVGDKLVDLNDNFSVYVYGQRRSGKTYCINHILDRIDERGIEYEFVALFSNTAANEEQWKQITPGFKFDAYDSEVVGQYIGEQRRRMEHNNAAEDIDKEEVPRIMIILDDCMSDKTVAHDTNLESLYTMGRHLNIDVITLVQDKKGCRPRIRGNSDLIIAFRSLSMIDREDLIRSFLAVTKVGREAFKLGVDFYEEVFRGHKHAALVVFLANSAGAADISDYAGRMLCPPKPPKHYDMGHNKYYKGGVMHEKAGVGVLKPLE